MKLLVAAETPRATQALVKLVMLSVGIALVIGAIYYVLNEARHALACRENLRRIYGALEIYDMTHGALPRLAFFSREPLNDPESICVALEQYGLEPDVWVCPASHRVIARNGLTYLWNTALNGRSLGSLSDRTWMLMNVQGLSRDVARPHLGYCNVLFTDGSVERIKFPDEQFPELRRGTR